MLQATPYEMVRELRKAADPERARVLARFFKTGKGEYGEGDTFLGITVLETRSIVKKFGMLSLRDLHTLLDSSIHEQRFAALLVLVEKYMRADDKKAIVDFYLAHTRFINNWDLVDLTADKILGSYLLDKDIASLQRLAASRNLWERRIAIIATFAFIKCNRFNETFLIAEKLLHDKHDLIHKAVGWMLREVGKRNQAAEEKFLRKHYRQMPRTMLRYAIERFPEGKRKYYLARAT